MRHRDILTILGVCTVYIFTFQEASISMYYCSNEKCMTSRRFFPNKPYICIPSWWIFHPGTCKLTSCWFTELMCRYPSNGIPNQGIVGLSALALEALLLMVIGCCCVQYVHPNMFSCGNSQASMVQCYSDNVIQRFFYEVTYLQMMTHHVPLFNTTVVTPPQCFQGW